MKEEENRSVWLCLDSSAKEAAGAREDGGLGFDIVREYVPVTIYVGDDDRERLASTLLDVVKQILAGKEIEFRAEVSISGWSRWRLDGDNGPEVARRVRDLRKTVRDQIAARANSENPED